VDHHHPREVTAMLPTSLSTIATPPRPSTTTTLGPRHPGQRRQRTPHIHNIDDANPTATTTTMRPRHTRRCRRPHTHVDDHPGQPRPRTPHFHDVDDAATPPTSFRRRPHIDTMTTMLGPGQRRP
jgi:hypothetical protein